jgi:tetratricopeptide (TPR) repeat protein
MRGVHLDAACALAMIAFAPLTMVRGQSVQPPVAEVRPEPLAAATLQGIVRDALKHTVAGATVCLQSKDAQIITVQTDAAGAYLFSAVRQGVYTLSAEMVGYGKTASSPLVLGLKNKTVDLTLNSAEIAEQKDSPAPQPEFFDEPHFTVAGVTDTTNLGGHGSDTLVRNRETLAQATASLGKQLPGGSVLDSSNPATEKYLRDAAARQPDDFDANFRLGKLLVEQAKPQEGLPYLEKAFRLNPTEVSSAYELALAFADSGDYKEARTHVRALLAKEKSAQQNAELHHLLADADEKLGDPLEAVREYQRAADLSPNEPNLFDWAVELLLHRATEPAIEVFTKGNRLFPRSVRMLVGLGAAWYSVGSYDQAAHRLCEASDMNPDDPNPYQFMGKMQAVETKPSEEIEERLARFVRLQPQNPWANYYYAISLQKRRKSPEDVENLGRVISLLQTAVQLDPKLGLAYLELGIIYSEQKDFPKAVSALQRAIEATPQLEQAHYRLAHLYREAGETAQAHAELQLYEQISKEKMQEIERQRHELQQFVYELRDRPPGSQW